MCFHHGTAILRVTKVTHTHRFNGHFPGKPGLPVSPLILKSPIIPILSILMGQAKTFHICLDTISPSLPWTSPLLALLKLHLHTSLESVCIILTLNMSKPPQSTSLNCQADQIKSQQSPNLCIFLAVLQIKTYIHLSILISFLSNYASCSTFIGQVSLP